MELKEFVTQTLTDIIEGVSDAQKPAEDKGGTNNLSNLRTLCNSCHEKLHPHMRD
jgi:5-methylcytosine-specific restriction endonuclease McrA